MSNAIHIQRLPFRKSDVAYIGDTWKDVLQIWEGDSVTDKDPADLSGAAFTAALKNANGDVIETFSEGDGIAVSGNTVTIKIPESITGDFVDKCCYMLDLQAVFTALSETVTYVRYAITATNDVTP